MARPLEGKLIHCKACGGASRRWVRWSNFTGNTVYYFCDNDCLGHWVQTERHRVADEVMAELREEHTHA
jgi:hypothetical protein